MFDSSKVKIQSNIYFIFTRNIEQKVDSLFEIINKLKNNWRRSILEFS